MPAEERRRTLKRSKKAAATRWQGPGGALPWSIQAVAGPGATPASCRRAGRSARGTCAASMVNRFFGVSTSR
jgi:hypothetical protein